MWGPWSSFAALPLMVHPLQRHYTQSTSTQEVLMQQHIVFADVLHFHWQKQLNWNEWMNWRILYSRDSRDSFVFFVFFFIINTIVKFCCVILNSAYSDCIFRVHKVHRVYWCHSIFSLEKNNVKVFVCTLPAQCWAGGWRRHPETSAVLNMLC